MTVLVTGATGFIGGVIVRCLRDAGMPVAQAYRQPGRLDGNGRTVPMPPVDAPASAYLDLMDGVTHVVHCAGLNNDANAAEADQRAANAILTESLAIAAAARAQGRFLYLSSIRAVAGPTFSGSIDESTPAAPDCAYGRSKREAELKAIEAYSVSGRSDLAILRLPPAYGPRMRGNLALLKRLADTALPLPLLGVGGVRSLVGVEAVARACVRLLSGARPLHPVYVVSDTQPVSVADIVGAFRQGYGRPTRLFAAPSPLLRTAAALAGRRRSWDQLAATQICDARLLASEGWEPEPDSLGLLRDLARSERLGKPQPR